MPDQYRQVVLHLLLLALSFGSLSVAAAETTTVQLTVAEPSGAARSNWPVTSGIPLGQGIVRDGEQAALFAGDGLQIPLQTEVLSRWPDGSVRWLLLDFQIDIAAGETKQLTLQCGSDVGCAPIANGVQAVSRGDAVVIDTGPMRVAVSPKSFRLLDDVRLDRDGDGSFTDAERLTAGGAGGIELRNPDGEIFTADLSVAQVVIEQNGPLRACVRLEGQHASQRGTMFRYVVRIHAFRGQPYLKLCYTFVNDYQPELMARIDSLALKFQLRDAANPVYLTDGRRTDAGRVEQIDDRTCEINGKLSGQRARGWIAQGSQHGGMAVGVREFWQNWPKGFEQKPGELQVDICPDFPAGRYDNQPITEECKLYYYLRDGVYSFKCGQARTHELWATFFGGAPEPTGLDQFFRAVETPLLAQCEPAYIVASRVKGPLSPANADKHGGYDALVDNYFDQHLADRDRVREFGMLNFGDWYNTNWDSWGNLEYDTARIWFQQYLRTGDRRYFDRAEQAARHFEDVDILHVTHPEIRSFPGTNDMRAGQVWPHLVGHTGGYYGRYVNGQYEGLAKLKMTGAYQVGLWDHGHTWIGGVFDHYLLTGDRRALEVGILASDAMAALCPTRYSDHIRQVGWPLHLLLNAYEATGKEVYLAAAGKQWKVLKDNFDPQKGWVIMLAHGHCSEAAESKRCRGNNFYMLGFTLTALARYHRLTEDPEVLGALSAGVEQMIREAWSEEHKSFYLTSCQHARSSPPAYSSATFHASEAFAYEARLTGNKEHGRIMRDALRTAIAAGMKSLEARESVGQTGYYSGIFLFPPFAFSALEDHREAD